MLTVGKLIEELFKYDKDLPVMIYAFEDGSMAHSVRPEPDIEKNKELMTKYDDWKENGLLYFKADHPFDYAKNNGKPIQKAICIKGDN